MAKSIREHKTQRLVIKQADVDVAIVPVVRWLNSFEGVVTLYSCQGDDDQKRPRAQGPYVLFFCHDPKDLMEILRETRNIADLVVNWAADHMPLRYVLQFHNQNGLKWLKDNVLDRKKR